MSAPTKLPKLPEGISRRFDAKGRPSYRGTAYGKATGHRRGPWTKSLAEAKSWRTKAMAEIDAGTAVRGDGATLRAEWEAFIEGAEAGAILDQKGTRYKPSSLRGYRTGWGRMDPKLADRRVADIRRADLQEFVDKLIAKRKPNDPGSPLYAAASIRRALDPLRIIFRRALQRDRITVNPTVGLDVPTTKGSRDRFASKAEASDLLEALPVKERALWATAFYAGLRRGELQSLRWDHVDFSKHMIFVRRSWDEAEGDQTPKTKGSKRDVPIVGVLASILSAHEAATGRSGAEFVFGDTGAKPFVSTTTTDRATLAWKNARLDRITLHEARHTFASMMIDAGANPKALSVILGHSSIGITFDTYGHLMKGGEDEVRRLLDLYLGP